MRGEGFFAFCFSAWYWNGLSSLVREEGARVKVKTGKEVGRKLQGLAPVRERKSPETGNKSCKISRAWGSHRWNPLVLRQREGSEGLL